jgi:hypothetical protein
VRQDFLLYKQALNFGHSSGVNDVKAKMNQFLAVGIMIAGLGLNAFAGPDLGAAMHTMATNLAAIQAQVPDSSQNVSTEALCDSLNAAIEQAKTITPDKITAMPAANQTQQMQNYVGMLSSLEGLVTQLKADLVANDNTSAAAVITQINALKVQGHTAFR